MTDDYAYVWLNSVHYNTDESDALWSLFVIL